MTGAPYTGPRHDAKRLQHRLFQRRFGVKSPEIDRNDCKPMQRPSLHERAIKHDKERDVVKKRQAVTDVEVPTEHLKEVKAFLAQLQNTRPINRKKLTVDKDALADAWATARELRVQLRVINRQYELLSQVWYPTPSDDKFVSTQIAKLDKLYGFINEIEL